MLKPARTRLPLDLASMPTDARYNKKFPRINPTLSSCRAPATNEARDIPPGPHLLTNARASIAVYD
jgi:hypothetical protein